MYYAIYLLWLDVNIIEHVIFILFFKYYIWSI